MRWSFLACALLLSQACGGSPETGRERDGGGTAAPEAGGRDAAIDAFVRPADPPGDDTYDWVLHVVRIADESPAGSGVAAGFDIDGHVTTSAADPIGCGRPDYTAPARFGGAIGVDNQITELLGLLLSFRPDYDTDQSMQQWTNDAVEILALRLTGVGDLVNDGFVDVAVYTVTIAAPPPMLQSVDYEGAPVDALSPGQRFDIEALSTIDGDPSRPRIALRDAWIEDGRLHTPSSPLSLRIEGSRDRSFAIDFNQARIQADVSADTLRNGMVAGHMSIDALVNLVLSAEPDPGITRDGLHTLLSGFADIDADPSSPGCDATSAAVVFEATTAVLQQP